MKSAVFTVVDDNGKTNYKSGWVLPSEVDLPVAKEQNWDKGLTIEEEQHKISHKYKQPHVGVIALTTFTPLTGNGWRGFFYLRGLTYSDVL